ncbi:MAG: hypothetical protein RR834_11315 [Thermomonas sp.]
MRIAISLMMAGCLLAAGCKKGDSGDAAASNAPSCSAADDLLLKIEGLNENVGMQDAFQAGLQTLPDNIREAAVNRINAKVSADGARMRADEGGPRQWVALLLLSTKSEARAVKDFRYCNGDFDFGNGQRWHWTYSMSNGPAGPELRIQSAQMASGGVATGSATVSSAQNASVVVTGVDTGNAVGADLQIPAPTASFVPMDAIFVAVSTKTSDPGASVPGKLSARWTYVDSNQIVHEEIRDVVFAGSGITNFQITKPDGWPTGNYLVEISLNGTLTQARSFQVRAGSDASTYADAASSAADAASAAADAAADDGHADGAYNAEASARERTRIAEERQQLERDRRELARQRDQVAAERAAESDAAREAKNQEQAWREQQETARRGPTADEQYESRRRECPGGFLGSECRKQIREQVCAGQWSPNPEPGYSACRR